MMVNIVVGKTKHPITKRLQDCTSLCIIRYTLFGIVLRTVNFQNQICLGAEKVNNEV